MHGFRPWSFVFVFWGLPRPRKPVLYSLAIPETRQPWGTAAYGLHSRRFNYLFHDGHVAIHPITATVGTGTTNAPRGMWTMVPGD